MPKILITGGQQRENGFELGEGKYYKAAKLLRLDTETGVFEELLSFTDGKENYPDEYPNLEFTVGAVEDDKLWLPTDTEVRLYNYPDLELLKIISFPFFHNIHHVAAFDDHIAVVSTGLDLIVLLSRDTLEPVEFINTEGKDPWHRFSKNTDYRKIHSTRPHDSHPNFIFKLDGDYWVTRCTQEDIVCLRDITKRVDISRKKTISIHDGLIVDGKIYFTEVDGTIVIVDAKTLSIVETIDLAQLDGKKSLKGWCRGILYEDDIFYVAFSRLRKTKNKKKLDWIRKAANKNMGSSDALIVAYDLIKKRKLGEWKLPTSSIDAIYGLLPEPSSQAHETDKNVLLKQQNRIT